MESGIAETLRAIVAGQGEGERVRRIEHDGIVYWVKRPEAHSLLWRLRKGDPARALERERQGLHAMRRLGLPVADLVHEGADYLVTRDAGIPLSEVVRSTTIPDEERCRALLAAATALHRIHEAGLAHGRPNLKDILWDGTDVTFIDLEMFGVVRNLRRAQILDLLMFGLSCFAVGSRSAPQIDAALLHYRKLDPGPVWSGAIRWLRRLRPVERATRPIQRSRKPLRDLRAFSALVEHMLDDEKRAAADARHGR